MKYTSNINVDHLFIFTFYFFYDYYYYYDSIYPFPGKYYTYIMRIMDGKGGPNIFMYVATSINSRGMNGGIICKSLIKLKLLMNGEIQCSLSVVYQMHQEGIIYLLFFMFDAKPNGCYVM